MPKLPSELIDERLSFLQSFDSHFSGRFSQGVTAALTKLNDIAVEEDQLRFLNSVTTAISFQAAPLYIADVRKLINELDHNAHPKVAEASQLLIEAESWLGLERPHLAVKTARWAFTVLTKNREHILRDKVRQDSQKRNEAAVAAEFKSLIDSRRFKQDMSRATQRNQKRAEKKAKLVN